MADLKGTTTCLLRRIPSFTYIFFQDEIRRWKSGVKSSSKERTCACTDRVFLAEVERKRLSDTVSNLRDERDKLKIEVIDLKQELMELRSRMEFGEKNSLLMAQQLMETTTK